MSTTTAIARPRADQNAAEAASPAALLQDISAARQQLGNSLSKLIKAGPPQLQLIPRPKASRSLQAAAKTVSETPASSVADVVSAIPAVEIPKVVHEYPLPGAGQTHEMAVVGGHMLAITQQTNSILVKVLLSETTGRPIACTATHIPDVEYWDGLHGLCASQYYTNDLWATLQFKSTIIRITPGLTLEDDPVNVEEIALPAAVRGPHCVYEADGNQLWTSCKDSHHVVRISIDDHTDCSIYPCSAHPIFITMHAVSKDMYASLDSSSKIWRLAASSGEAMEMEIPSTYGSTPVGLVTGTDGNVWFTLVGSAAGGAGTFARILSTGEFQWFALTTPVAADAGLIHLAFDWDEQLKRLREGVTEDNTHRLWLLGSTLVADEGKSVDAVFSVLVDTNLGRIVTQKSIALPTQRSFTHRVIPHRTGLFVSQLGVSSIAHITGSVALHVEDAPGETTDYYSDFGQGEPYGSYTFKVELPQKRRMTLLPPHASKLADANKGGGDATALAERKPTAIGRASKRPRANVTT